jgi:hypothetical protein
MAQEVHKPLPISVMSEEEIRIDSIWRKRDEELDYWLREHLGPLEAKDLSIHEIDRGGGGFSTIIYDIEGQSAVLINTDTTATTPEDSHCYVMIEPKVLMKLNEIVNKSGRRED